MNYIGDPVSLLSLYDEGPAHAQSTTTLVTKELDDDHRAFLGDATLVVVATADSAGLTCSPRGGDAGTLAVVKDDRTLWLPDAGGRIHQTVHNLMADPRIGLLFVAPGREDTLRVQGTARVSADSAALATATLDGLAPQTVIVVDIQHIRVSGRGPLRRAKLC